MLHRSQESCALVLQSVAALVRSSSGGFEAPLEEGFEQSFRAQLREELLEPVASRSERLEATQSEGLCARLFPSHQPFESSLTNHLHLGVHLPSLEGGVLVGFFDSHLVSEGNLQHL